MSSVWHSHVIRMSLVCTSISLVCHSYVLLCHRYVTRMYPYVIRMSLVCIRMSSVRHSYVLAYHPYVTRMYSYVIRITLVCTRMSSVGHSYVLVCHPYVTRMWFYHEPSASSWLLVASPHVEWYVIKFHATTNYKPLCDKWPLNGPISSSIRDRLFFSEGQQNIRWRCNVAMLWVWFWVYLVSISRF